MAEGEDAMSRANRYLMRRKEEFVFRQKAEEEAKKKQAAKMATDLGSTSSTTAPVTPSVLTRRKEEFVYAPRTFNSANQEKHTINERYKHHNKTSSSSIAPEVQGVTRTNTWPYEMPETHMKPRSSLPRTENLEDLSRSSTKKSKGYNGSDFHIPEQTPQRGRSRRRGSAGAAVVREMSFIKREMSLYNRQRSEAEAGGDSSMKMILIDDAIDTLGMGCFQRTILVTIGLVFAAECIEFVMLGFLASTLQTQWGIDEIKADETLNHLVMAVFLGGVAGSLLLGCLSDRLGRKPMFIVVAFVISVFGHFATALFAAKSFAVMVALRVIVGFGLGGLTVPFDILAELLPTTHRGRHLLFVELFRPLGMLFVPLVAITLGHNLSATGQDHAENEWQWYVAILGIPSLMAGIMLFAVVPESPRWLLPRGKHDQALQILRAAARANGKDDLHIFPLGTVLLMDDDDDDTNQQQSNCRDLCHSQWRWKVVILCVCWGALAVCYYGAIGTISRVFNSTRAQFSFVQDETKNQSETADMDQASGELPTGEETFDQFDVVANASSEIAGIIFALLLLERVGRIPTQVATFVGGGVGLLGLTVMASQEQSHNSFSVGREQWVLFAFLARMLFMAGRSVMWVSTAELLPTPVRGTGHGWANGFARLAGALTPYLVREDRPLVVVGGIVFALSMAAAAFTAQLPETHGRPLGSEVEDDGRDEYRVDNRAVLDKKMMENISPLRYEGVF